MENIKYIDQSIRKEKQLKRKKQAKNMNSYLAKIKN